MKKYRWPYRNGKSFTGFTLVELLVVISIIALLLSILMPSLNKARRAAKNIVCLSNTKSLGLGMHLYLNDNIGKFPKIEALSGSSSAVEKYWTWLLMPYHGNSVAATNKLRNCPEVTIEQGPSYVGGPRTRWRGSAGSFLNDGKDRKFTGSYGYNIWLNKQAFSYMGMHPSIGDQYVFKTAANVRKASMTPAFADSSWPHGCPSGNLTEVLNIKDYSGYDRSTGALNMTGVYVMNRHDMKTNIGMVDGSASRVELKDLYKYYWHAKWEPQEIKLPAKK